MSILEAYERVSSANPCPVCARPDWCLLARDGSAALCQRVESPRRWGDAGHHHRLAVAGIWPCAPDGEQGDGAHRTPDRSRTRTIGDPPPGCADIAEIAESAFENGLPELGQLATQLSVTFDALLDLRVGLDEAAVDPRRRRVWTFPMMDAHRRVVGVRLRWPNARKTCVPGSRNGLFIPASLPEFLDTGEPLLLPEGPTDAAALLGLGFHAVGRPNCSAGAHHMVRLVIRLRARFVVVVADDDEAGKRGADRVARALRPYCRYVRVVAPPAGIKDARAWVRAGATHNNVSAAIAAAPDYQLDLVSREVA